MDYKSAAAASGQKMAALALADRDRWEIYDEGSNSFFQASTADPEKPWEAERKVGRGNRKSEDWVPLEVEAAGDAVRLWMANQEGRSVVIEKPWDLACMNSPVNRAWRVKKDGLVMVRTGDKTTWSEELGGTILSQVPGPFKQYDGWEPVPPDHFYATVDLTSPYTIRFGEGGRLGEKAFTKPAEREVKPKKKGKVPNPTAPAIEVSAETLGVAASIAQSLAEAIGSTTGETQKDLAAELKRLASHVSWHLREDRGKYRDPPAASVPQANGVPAASAN